MNNTTGYPKMPKLSSTEFVGMLRGNESVQPGTITSGTIPSNSDNRFLQEITAARNVGRHDIASHGAVTRGNWKTEGLLRGLMLCSSRGAQHRTDMNSDTASGFGTGLDNDMSCRWQMKNAGGIRPDVATMMTVPFGPEAVSYKSELDATPSHNVAISVSEAISDSLRAIDLSEKSNQTGRTKRAEKHSLSGICSLPDEQIGDPLVQAQIQDIWNFLISREPATRNLQYDHNEYDRVLLLNYAVGYFSEKPKRAKGLFRRLARLSGDYGGEKEDKVSEKQYTTYLGKWFATRFLGMTPASYVGMLLQKEGASIGAASNAAQHNTVAAIRRHFDLALDCTSSQKFGLSTQARAYLRERVLLHALPGIFWQPSDDDLFASMLVGSLSWGEIQAGVGWAMDLGIDTSEWQVNTAREFGQLLYVLVRESAAPASWFQYFALPATLVGLKKHGNQTSATLTVQRDDLGVVTHEGGKLAEDFFRYQVAFESAYERDDMLEQYHVAIDGYQTRPQLAESLLRKRCPGLSDFEKQARGYLTAERAYCVDLPKDWRWHDPAVGRFRDPRVGGFSLPIVNDAFLEQNKRIGRLAADALRMVFPFLFAQLSLQEHTFLVSADVYPASAYFSARDAIRHTAVAGNPAAIRGLTTHLPEAVSLFMARYDGDERIYALFKNTDAEVAQVARVDRNSTFYHEKLTELTGMVLSFDPDYKLYINPVRKLLKSRDEDISMLYSRAAQAHSEKLEKALYQYGYQATRSERIWEWIKDLLPFYRCATGIPNFDERVAIACLTDALTLLPPAGRALALSTRIAEMMTFSALSSWRSVLAKATLRTALMEAARTLPYSAHVAHATVLKNADFARIAADAVRAFDPGVEVLGTLGMTGIGRLRRMIAWLSDLYPASRHIIEKMPHWRSRIASATHAAESSLALNVPVAPGALVKGRLPGSDTLVDLVKVEERFGQGVYVCVAKSTGERYGKRYYLDSDGNLTPVGVSLAVRMKIVRTQGLAGKGAIDAGRQMARRTKPCDDVTSSQATFMHLSRDELEPIFFHCDLVGLASMAQVTALGREVAFSTFQRAWPHELQIRKLIEAVSADEPGAIRFAGEAGLTMDNIFIHDRSLLSEAMHHKLHQKTYEALLQMTQQVNGQIIRLSDGMSRKLDVLEAAIQLGNPAAVAAILREPRYQLPAEDGGGVSYVVAAIRCEKMPVLRALVRSGRVDINKSVFGSVPLRHEMVRPGNSLTMVRYMLSLPHIDLNAEGVLSGFGPVSAEKYREVMRDPRARLNEVHGIATQYTALTSAIEWAMHSGDRRVFNLLIADSRINVNVKVRSDRGAYETACDVARRDHAGYARAHPGFKNDIVLAIQAHPSYQSRRKCIVS
ncbi:hypothetical protein [Robbsia andropogonis]|uniref:hypothetical protein n=1 Tax=Robbsia andropogonis TaxID=28092 RepID=UPI000466A0BB|nr:hypothetical protein [Robbsia andropogonis]